MPKLPDIDQFFSLRTTTDLGLLKDIKNPISKMEKLGILIISETYRARGETLQGSLIWVIL